MQKPKPTPRPRKPKSEMVVTKETGVTEVVQEFLPPTEGVDDERGGLPSASSMPRIKPCRASFKLEQGRTDKGNKHSKRGDRIHLAMAGEMRLEDMPSGDAKTADIMMNIEAELVQKYGFEGAVDHREERLWLVGDEMKPIASAKPDVLKVLGLRGMIINYKTGFLDQKPIEQNEQVETEAVVAHTNYGINDLIMVVLQPTNVPPYAVRRIHGQELLDLVVEIGELSLDAMEPGHKPKPGWPHCQYCKAKPICKPYREMASRTVAEVVPSLAAVTPEQRGARMRVLRLAEDVCKSEKDQMRELMKADPKAVFGFRLGTARRSQKVTASSLPSAIGIMESMGVPVFQCVTFSIPSAKTAYAAGSVKLGTTKKAAEALVEERLGELIEVSYSEKPIEEDV